MQKVTLEFKHKKHVGETLAMFGWTEAKKQTNLEPDKNHEHLVTNRMQNWVSAMQGKFVKVHTSFWENFGIYKKTNITGE